MRHTNSSNSWISFECPNNGFKIRCVPWPAPPFVGFGTDSYPQGSKRTFFRDLIFDGKPRMDFPVRVVPERTLHAGVWDPVAFIQPRSVGGSFQRISFATEGWYLLEGRRLLSPSTLQMVEGLRFLRVKDRYADEDEYLRTYLPLLWAETGASLQGAGQGSDRWPRLHSVVRGF